MQPVNCKQWIDVGIEDGGACSLGLYGGRPSHGVCRQCPSREPVEPEGLGDRIGRWLHRIRVDRIAGLWTRLTGRACGCDRRRKFLNRVGRKLGRITARAGKLVGGG